MPVLELTFLTGRYHATPWGRNVNEGEPEWPPSPFRMARALLDIWYRRFTHKFSQEQVIGALSLLSGKKNFALPPTGQSVTKAYLKTNSSAQPILDAFVTLDRTESIYMEITEGDANDLVVLEHLFMDLNYLGRSESWVQAKIVKDIPATYTWNCIPKENSTNADDYVTTHALCPEQEYWDLPYLPQKKGKGKKSDSQTLSWFEALQLSTAELFKEGWNRHPLLTPVTYGYHTQKITKVKPFPIQVQHISYALHSNVLPLIEDTYTLARRTRLLLMGIHKRIMGDAALVSPIFSGKDEGGQPLKGHIHAYFRPVDLDNDGRIDHLHVYADKPFTEDELQALYALRKIWTPGKAHDLQVTLLHALATRPQKPATRFVSKTPLVLQRFWRKGRGDFSTWLKHEICRACMQQGLPEPIEIIGTESTSPATADRKVRWTSFIRTEANQRPNKTYGFELVFAEPVQGPFSLGALAHYGLGVFVEDETKC